MCARFGWHFPGVRALQVESEEEEGLEISTFPALGSSSSLISQEKGRNNNKVSAAALEDKGKVERGRLAWSWWRNSIKKVKQRDGAKQKQGQQQESEKEVSNPFSTPSATPSPPLILQTESSSRSGSTLATTDSYRHKVEHATQAQQLLLLPTFCFTVILYVAARLVVGSLLIPHPLAVLVMDAGVMLVFYGMVMLHCLVKCQTSKTKTF